MEKSARNKRNRACLREIDAEKDPEGREPSRVEVFLLNHTHGNNELINAEAEAEEKYKQMLLLMNPEDGSEPMDAEAAYIHVMGPNGRGRMRRFGVGVARQRVEPGGDRGPLPEVVLVMERAAATEKRVEEMEERLAAIEKRLEEMQKQHDSDIAQMKEVRENQRQFQRMIERCLNNGICLTPNFSSTPPEGLQP